MIINIPSPDIHTEVAINQHLVPQCYMREWSYNGGSSVWVYNKVEQYNKEKPEKSDWNIVSRKTKKINSLNNFHDLKAGSLYMPDDALNDIFGFLQAFNIYLDSKQLKTQEERNQYYYRFSDWKIFDSDGNLVSQENKDKIKEYLSESRYTYIETEWARAYENNWRGYISDIEQKVRTLKNTTPTGLEEPHQGTGISKDDIDMLMKYLIIYDWRSFKGNKNFNDVVEAIKHIIPELQNIEVPKNERIHMEDATIMDEIIHNIKLKHFVEFLKNNSGMLRAFIDEYKKNMTICFGLTDIEHPFITSNTPAFIFTRVDGMNEHILVARPTMLISLGRGESNHFIISNLSAEQVGIYNKGIAAHGELLILPRDDFDVYSLLN